MLSGTQKTFTLIVGVILVLIFHAGLAAGNTGRVVIIKIDGLSGDYVDQWVNRINPKTGKSRLPWFNEVFYKNGTRLANFYSRGTSVSAPSWSMIDTGHHLQIKNNIEYDRFTNRKYDYLNFFSFYLNSGLNKRADMPGTEVLDRLHIPLLIDAIPKDQRYVSPQLFQREINWDHTGLSFANFYPRNPTAFINEWLIGFNYHEVPYVQAENDIVRKLHTRPNIDYFDYFSSNFDHVSHLNRDEASRLSALTEVDRTVGRIWKAIQTSDRADETTLIIVSDHGINSDHTIYSQGHNLVDLLSSPMGGAHHSATKRRVKSKYSIKSLLPFDLLHVNPSKHSQYLKGQSKDYPTALLDVDGNERAAFHFRDNDLNLIHILLQQIKLKNLPVDSRKAAEKALFGIIDRRRTGWEDTITYLSEELAALKRYSDHQLKVIQNQKKISKKDPNRKDNVEMIRISVEREGAQKELLEYRKYLNSLKKLLALRPELLESQEIKIEDFVGPRVMGDSNSVFDLQNYVVGLSEKGLVVDSNGNLDLEMSFRRVDYSTLFTSQKVRNSVQREVSSRPIDFAVTGIPVKLISRSLVGASASASSAVWISSSTENQALILGKTDNAGKLWLRYLPISNLQQESKSGAISFDYEKWGSGFPLNLFEDDGLNVPPDERSKWLSEWHSETEWMRAIHKTKKSNGLISLHEQIVPHFFDQQETSGLRTDQALLKRFRHRQRLLATPDLLILANNHWNFNLQSLNPGGNHGSFFRISSNSLLMMAGGSGTGVPRGLKIEEPYDALSVAPTILQMMEKIDDQGNVSEDLYRRGFRKFPGRIIKEVIKSKKRN